MPETKNNFNQLLAIMDKLRGEGGCPWDREQTTASLTPFLLEETYEVLDAIEDGSTDDLKNELGDLLYQIIFYARIAKEEGKFNIEEVIAGINEKMIRRHPHVFGDEKVSNTEEVLHKWEKIKRQENKAPDSFLGNIPKQLPALLKAHKIQEKVSRIGFDWKQPEEVIEKIEEEIIELKTALSNNEPKEIEAELGDLLFSVVNLSRFVKVDPEEALRKCVNRFIERFNFMESEAKNNGRALKEMSLAEMNNLWERAKIK